MIDEMICTARSKNKGSKSVFLGLLGSTMLLVLIAYIVPKFKGIVWLFVLGFATATIYVYNRYVGSEYIYAITNDGGIPTFTLGMKLGNTTKTMARLDLDSITEVRRMNCKEYHAYKCEKGVVKYPYFPTMFADDLYLVSIRSEYENADIFIEASEEFASALDSYVVKE